MYGSPYKTVVHRQNAEKRNWQRKTSVQHARNRCWAIVTAVAMTRPKKPWKGTTTALVVVVFMAAHGHTRHISDEEKKRKEFLVWIFFFLFACRRRRLPKQTNEKKNPANRFWEWSSFAGLGIPPSFIYLLFCLWLILFLCSAQCQLAHRPPPKSPN